MAFEELLKELAARRQRALGMGGAEKLAQRKAQGVLNARERIDRLFDAGTFLESGMLAVSNRPEDRLTTPADGKVGGFGRIDGREAGVLANDFTVKGASSASINIKKLKHMKNTAKKRGVPMVFLGESTGARMPDVMGASSIGSKDDPTEYQRMREVPWAAAVLGHCYGSSAWYGSMSDFCVMRKGAIMAVSSPRLISMATGKAVDPEELGGWRVHAEVSGLVDQVVDSDEEAIDAVKQFLSYHAEPSQRSAADAAGAARIGRCDQGRDEAGAAGQQPGLRHAQSHRGHRRHRVGVRAQGALRQNARDRVGPARRPNDRRDRE
jgi:acetyl-CoA carboxylase carboxyltransferase component